jgi:hypothetical protein
VEEVEEVEEVEQVSTELVIFFADSLLIGDC